VRGVRKGPDVASTRRGWRFFGERPRLKIAGELLNEVCIILFACLLEVLEGYRSSHVAHQRGRKAPMEENVIQVPPEGEPVFRMVLYPLGRVPIPLYQLLG